MCFVAFFSCRIKDWRTTLAKVPWYLFLTIRFWTNIMQSRAKFIFPHICVCSRALVYDHEYSDNGVTNRKSCDRNLGFSLWRCATRRCQKKTFLSGAKKVFLTRSQLGCICSLGNLLGLEKICCAFLQCQVFSVLADAIHCYMKSVSLHSIF